MAQQITPVSIHQVEPYTLVVWCDPSIDLKQIEGVHIVIRDTQDDPRCVVRIDERYDTDEVAEEIRNMVQS